MKSESKKPASNNVMKKIVIDKVTFNISAGIEQDQVEKAITLLSRLTGKPPVKTISKKRIPTWNLRPGLPIGAMITMRGKEAEELLKRILKSIDFELPESCFVPNGFSFGVKEYIDIEGMKYDPKLGIMGFDVCVTLRRPGYNIALRKVKKSFVGAKHKITKEESREFAMSQLGIKMKEEE